MSFIEQKAYAKVNLSLDICGKRQDGYHLLRSVMQQITLCDDILAETSDTISIDCNQPFIPTDEKNIVWKIAEAFFNFTGLTGRGVHFSIHKRIPSGAGLGGGSADGIAALRCLDQLYHTALSASQMVEIAAPIGADLPFFLYGGTALAEGIGEKITPLSPLSDGTLLLVKPKFGMSTPKMYQALDQAKEYSQPDTEKMIEAVSANDVGAVGAALGNSLQSVGEQLYPELQNIRWQLLRLGAGGAVMSGSGSTVFGIFKNETAAKAAAPDFIRQGYGCYAVRPKK